MDIPLSHVDHGQASGRWAMYAHGVRTFRNSCGRLPQERWSKSGLTFQAGWRVLSEGYAAMWTMWRRMCVEFEHGVASSRSNIWNEE